MRIGQLQVNCLVSLGQVVLCNRHIEGFAGFACVELERSAGRTIVYVRRRRPVGGGVIHTRLPDWCGAERDSDRRRAGALDHPVRRGAEIYRWWWGWRRRK